MVTFLLQAVTGMGRLVYQTAWGKSVVGLFGGYSGATAVHNTVGVLMIIGFAIHIGYILAKVEWKAWRRSLFSPDSLAPRLEDARHLGQKVRWFYGRGRLQPSTAGPTGKNSTTGRSFGACPCWGLPASCS